MITTFDSAIQLRKRIVTPQPDQRRLKRVRLTGKILARIASAPWGRKAVLFARRFGLGRSILDWGTGFRRAFPTLEAARLGAAAYLPFDHSHPDNATLHLQLAERLRPSDYPVLFHLQNMDRIDSVFDLGGNVGNLFYSYGPHILRLKTASWRVCDVPSIASLGEALAKDRNESRLSFVSELTSLADADVLLVSGSLHYFEETLPQMLARQLLKPKHVIVNRTPLLANRSVCTVQDAVTFLAACKMHSRDALVSGMQELGYQCVDEWTVPELSLIVPCFPELSAPLYSGLYFRLGAPAEVKP